MTHFCPEYKLCLENGFIKRDTPYSKKYDVISLYNSDAKLPLNIYQSLLKFCPFCGVKL